MAKTIKYIYRVTAWKDGEDEEKKEEMKDYIYATRGLAAGKVAAKFARSTRKRRAKSLNKLETVRLPQWALQNMALQELSGKVGKRENGNALPKGIKNIEALRANRNLLARECAMEERKRANWRWWHIFCPRRETRKIKKTN